MHSWRTPKLLLIALDAADSRLVQDWAAAGYLPTMAKLLDTGAMAPVTTPLGVLEGAVWPTFHTSLSPATHGMYAYLQTKPGSYALETAMRADRLQFPPFWVRLSEAGRRVAVIDAPFAKPLRGLNGVQVVNWGAHDAWSWKRSSWPPHLMRDLLTRFGDHPVPTCDAEERSWRDYEALRARLIAGAQQKAKLLRYCLEMDNWDFFFGVFSESHCVGHQFWHFSDPGHPEHDPTAPPELISAIRDVYQAIDAGLAGILERVSPDTHVLVVLSHGMGPYYHGSHLLDEVLERLGINDPTSRGSSSRTAHDELRELAWDARRLLPVSARLALKSQLPNHLVKALWRWTHPEPRPAWHRMRAFQVPSSHMTGLIRINLKGREPAGIVQPGNEYRGLCKELIDGLMALENHDTGQRAVHWVLRADELYQGPRLSELPDLFVEWDHSAPISRLRSPHIGTVGRTLDGSRTGSHWQNALLVGIGPDFRSGKVHGKIRTVDIAPTILDFFGVPVPNWYEGATALPLLRTESLPGPTETFARQDAGPAPTGRRRREGA